MEVPSNILLGNDAMVTLAITTLNVAIQSYINQRKFAISGIDLAWVTDHAWTQCDVITI
jgi:hypothetical protein